jgi:hypothetical protein
VVTVYLALSDELSGLLGGQTRTLLLYGVALAAAWVAWKVGTAVRRWWRTRLAERAAHTRGQCPMCLRPPEGEEVVAAAEQEIELLERWQRVTLRVTVPATGAGVVLMVVHADTALYLLVVGVIGMAVGGFAREVLVQRPGALAYIREMISDCRIKDEQAGHDAAWQAQLQREATKQGPPSPKGGPR